MQLHHTGYIVNNADDPSAIEVELHLVNSVIDSAQEAKICLYKNKEGQFIELIQPLNEKSPVWNFLKKRGSGFHHQCYEGSRMEIEKYIRERKLYIIKGPVSAAVFNDRKILFCINREETIVEFIIE